MSLELADPEHATRFLDRPSCSQHLANCDKLPYTPILLTMPLAGWLVLGKNTDKHADSEETKNTASLQDGNCILALSPLSLFRSKDRKAWLAWISTLDSTWRTFGPGASLRRKFGNHWIDTILVKQCLAKVTLLCRSEHLDRQAHDTQSRTRVLTVRAPWASTARWHDSLLAWLRGWTPTWPKTNILLAQGLLPRRCHTHITSNSWQPLPKRLFHVTPGQHESPCGSSACLLMPK